MTSDRVARTEEVQEISLTFFQAGIETKCHNCGYEIDPVVWICPDCGFDL